ncbi:hypothetical protein Hanom_Chr04g00380741 [Helianthus anomalus]
MCKFLIYKNLWLAAICTPHTIRKSKMLSMNNKPERKWPPSIAAFSTLSPSSPVGASLRSRIFVLITNAP